MRTFEAPLAIKNMRIKNRFLRSATMENMADGEGRVTDDLLKLYYDLARGGTGLIITGACAIHPKARVWPYQMAIWDDSHMKGMSKLAKIIHRYGVGCKCAVQLHHGGTAGFGYSYGTKASDFSLQDLAEKEIKDLIEAFGQAASRVRAADFDAIAVHGAHGYLISQFLSPAINARTDRWGGSAENRARFAVEICRAIREHVGEEMPLLWKLNCADFHQKGQGIKDYVEVAGRLVAAGADLIELTGGLKDQLKLRAKLMREAGAHEAYFRDAIEPFRQVLPKCTLAITGGVRSPAVFERLLDEGLDLIGMCRPLICEPDLPNRLMNTLDKRRAKCTSCNKCLIRIANQSLKCVEFDEMEKIIKGL